MGRNGEEGEGDDQFNGPTGINTAQALASSGSVAGTKGQPFNVMDPFLTLNYIIYAGATS